MTKPLIRRATIADLGALAPLFEGYRAFYRCAPAPTASAAFLSDRFRNDESIVFLATLADDVVGFTQLYPTFGSLSLGRILVLNDLFVTPAARGHGVGRALIDRAVQFGREVGAVSLSLATEVTNEVGQRLYQSAGWTRDTSFLHYEYPLR